MAAADEQLVRVYIGMCSQEGLMKGQITSDSDCSAGVRVPCQHTITHRCADLGEPTCRDASGEWIRLGLDDLIHHFGAAAFIAIKKIAQPAFKTKGKDIIYAPELEPLLPASTSSRLIHH